MASIRETINKEEEMKKSVTHKQHMEWVEVKLSVYRFFDYNYKKTHQWIRSNNPLLGNISPLQMHLTGRTAKLLKVIKLWISENKPA